MLRAWLLFTLTVAASGQSILGGVKLGVPFTQYFETGASGSRNGSAVYSAATRRYTFGAAGEFRFARALGLEADALFHRMGYVAIVHFFDTANGNFSNSAVDVKGDSWDFPVMAKYRFGRAGRPFVAAGGVLRYVGPVRGKGQQTAGSLVTGASTTTPVDNTDPSELRKRVYPGVTAGAGIEVGLGRFRLLPELRYTHWTANISRPGGLLRFAPNQAEFLVGLLL